MTSLVPQTLRLCDFGLEIWRKHSVIYDNSKVGGVTESRSKWRKVELKIRLIQESRDTHGPLKWRGFDYLRGFGGGSM